MLTPNPFYQAYGAAALAAGAELVPVAATAATGFLPDYAALPAATLDRVSLAYVCSPSNPQGAVADEAYWRTIFELAERHDFIVLADECYSEIWRGAPPPGALEVARGVGADPARVVVFHSLSKRSGVPGLRSGFAAGGAGAIDAMKRLRSYGGAPSPLPLQRAAAALWRDEAHVEASRALYVAKFEAADAILGDLPGYVPPRAGFFLWLAAGDGEAATLRLWREAGVKALPGAYLGRATERCGQSGARLRARGARRRARRRDQGARGDPRRPRVDAFRREGLRMAQRAKAKRRSPLMESDTEEALRRRGTELLGLILIGVAALAWTTLWTYSPDDPSLFSATDDAPRNALGLVGASLADPLHRALGWAAFGAPVALAVWGMRLVLHSGENRVLSRLIALPVAALAAAAFAASHVPLAGWPHSYGLGGLLGDATLGAALEVVPLEVAIALPLVSVALAIVFVATAGYALGLTWAEVGSLSRFAGQGSVLLYSGAHGLAGRALGGAAAGASRARDLAARALEARQAAARERGAAAPASAIPRFDPAALRATAEGQGRPKRSIPPVAASDRAPEARSRSRARRDRDGGRGARTGPDPAAARLARAERERRDPRQEREGAARGTARTRARRGDRRLPDAAARVVAGPRHDRAPPSEPGRARRERPDARERARRLRRARARSSPVRPGPVVTMYELEPAPGLKASRVIGLSRRHRPLDVGARLRASRRCRGAR